MPFLHNAQQGFKAFSRSYNRCNNIFLCVLRNSSQGSEILATSYTLSPISKDKPNLFGSIEAVRISIWQESSLNLGTDEKFEILL